MNRYINISLSAVVATLLIGCGSSESDNPNDLQNESSSAYKITDNAVKITSAAEAENAIAATLKNDSIMNVAQTSGVSMYSVAKNETNNSNSLLRSMHRVAEVENCYEGGTISSSGVETPTSFKGTITHSQCNDGYAITNGVMKIDANINASTKKVDLFTSMENYSMNFNGMNGSMTAGLSMKVEGTANSLEYNQEWEEYDFDYLDPMKIVLNGEMNLDYDSMRGALGYENFTIEMSNHVNTDYGSEYINQKINGKVSINQSINSCANGSYAFVTTSDLINSPSGYTSGTLKINDATLKFMEGGMAEVTFANGEKATINQTQEVACN